MAQYARKTLSTLVCVAAIFAAGCHRNNQTSGFGIGWVTLSDTPGDFTSYIVNVDSVTLTGKNVGVVTAVAAVETVDFTKLKDISELWSAASIPNDTYTTATITLDYTSANISVMVNGLPQKATVVNSAGTAVTTIATVVNFDSAHPLVIQPTYASTSALRLALDFDLPASNVVSLATSPAKVTVKPFWKIATSAPDTKPVRVRGPLINSSVSVGTYTVYVRPFFDEVNSLGSLSIFNGPNTLYQINGTSYVGAAGLNVLSQTSAGTTITAAYTTFEPTATLNASVTAGKFNSSYVIAGSTLEDFYTQGLEGDVIARSGNTLTLLGSTLQLNDGTSSYNNANAVVILGPSTLVTLENSTATGLDYKDISVGQHIIARGIYQLPASGVVTLDATGSSSTNTGSVRIQTSQAFGSLVSSTTGSLVLDLQTINNWPASSYNFAGNGTSAAQDPVPASYVVDTGALTTTAVAGAPVWINGYTTAFGAAPPDFNATSINTEVSVPATLEVSWTAAGTITPFSTLTSTGMTINLANTSFSSGVIRIGSESLDLTTLPASPSIVPAATPAATPGLPDVYLPQFAVGAPLAAAGISVYNTFATFASKLPTVIVAASPALQFVASGTYNRTTNLFTASSIDVVL